MLWALASSTTDPWAPPGPTARNVLWDAMWKRATLKEITPYNFWKATDADRSLLEAGMEDYVVTQSTSKTILTFSQDPLENAVMASELLEVATSVYDPSHTKSGERLLAWAKRQRDANGRGVALRGNPLPPGSPEEIETQASRYYDVLFMASFFKGLVLYEPPGGWLAMREATTFGYLNAFVRNYWPWLLLGATGIAVGTYYLTKRHPHARHST